MHVPVWPTLPQSDLSPFQVQQKFNVSALGSLGCDCSDIDPESGVCMDPDPCDMSGGPSVSLLPPSTFNPQPSLPTTSLPQMGPPPLATGSTGDLSSYFASIGVTPPPPGTPINIPTTNGQTTTYVNQGTAASPNYVPLLTSAVQGAVNLAALMTVKPGQTITGPGGVVISGGGVLPTGTVLAGNTVTASVTSNTMMLMALLAVGAFALFSSKGGRG